jgi:hypothetical protein
VKSEKWMTSGELRPVHEVNMYDTVG